MAAAARYAPAPSTTSTPVLPHTDDSQRAIESGSVGGDDTRAAEVRGELEAASTALAPAADAPGLVNGNEHVIDDEEPVLTFRMKVYQLFDDPGSSRLATVIAVVILALIFLSCTTFCLETLPQFHKKPDQEYIWNSIEYVCITVFTIDYTLRLFTCPKLRPFLFDFLNIVDVVSILPFYFEILFKALNPNSEGNSSTTVFRVMRLVRVTRVFKVSRYVAWLSMFYHAIVESIAPLGMLVFVMTIVSVFLSSGMYFMEHGDYDADLGVYLAPDGTPTKFESIPAAMWWCLVTMTTVGYGDIVPQTTVGKLLAALTSVVGILVLAIPITVISTNFNVEYDKHKKAKEVARARLVLLKNHFMKKKSGLDAMTDEVEDLVKRSYHELQDELDELIDASKKEMLLEISEVIKLAYDNRQSELREFERRNKKLGSEQPSAKRGKTAFMRKPSGINSFFSGGRSGVRNKTVPEAPEEEENDSEPEARPLANSPAQDKGSRTGARLVVQDLNPQP